MLERRTTPLSQSNSTRHLSEGRRAEDKVRWSEALLRSITESSPGGVYVGDSRTDKVLYYNSRFCPLLGIQEIPDLCDQFGRRPICAVVVLRDHDDDGG